MCVCFGEAAQVSNKTSWFEEENWKPHWQRVSGEGQEQPSNIQLPCLNHPCFIFIFSNHISILYMTRESASLFKRLDVSRSHVRFCTVTRSFVFLLWTHAVSVVNYIFKSFEMLSGRWRSPPPANSIQIICDASWQASQRKTVIQGWWFEII